MPSFYIITCITTCINHDGIDSFERKRAVTKRLREEVCASLSLALVWGVERLRFGVGKVQLFSRL